MPDITVTESLQLRAAELDTIMHHAEPPPKQMRGQASLAAVLDDNQAKWAFSKDGANGAMLVRTGAEVTGGAAIKVETPFTAAAVDKTAQMMETFFQNAQGDAPFVAPRVTLISPQDLAQDPGLVLQLKERLQALKAEGVHDPVRVDDQIKRLTDVEKGTAQVVKMEFAQGEQINKISLADRLAMAQTDAFPQAIGKALPVFTAMGMNDHLGLSETNYKNNAANLMFDTKSGQLSAIDFSTGMQFDPVDRGNEALIAYREPDADKSLKRLNTFLENSLKDEASFEAAVQRMANGQPTPLTPVMDAFVRPMDEVHMFEPGDEAVLEEHLSMEDKKRFAANLILGAAKGLDYLKLNEPALRTAAQATHQQVGEKVIHHIQTPASLDAIRAELKKVNGPELIAKAELRAAPLRLAALDRQAGPLKAALDEVTAKLDRLEHKPTLGDRVKFLMKGRDEVIHEIQKKKSSLEIQAKDIREESHMLLNRQSEAQHQQEQAAKLKAAAGEEPRHRLRDDVAVANIAAHHPQHLHPVEAADLNQEPHKLREDREMVEVVEHVEELHKPAAPKAGDERMEVKSPKPNIPKKL